MNGDLQFHVADYIVMTLFLVISTGIGIYCGLCKSQKTTEDYLLGGRKMHLLPVSISLMVTYQSAISVMGIPTEIYIYDTMMVYGWIAIMLTNIFQAFVLVPLLHPLKLTSTYEYLGRRFQSRSVQLLGTIMGMLQTLLYMAIVLLAPALALEAVASIPLWLSVVVVGVLGTIYTSIGGIRTVIWTDVFQFVILFGGLIVILIMGTINIGGLAKIFEVAKEGSRINFSTTSLDPRVRHTVWGMLFAGFVNWMPNCCNQSAVQRISSMRTARDAKIATFMNVPMILVYGFILTFTGLLLYAHYAIQQCDPWSAGYISNANQLVPYFVMNVFRDIPGLSGLFIAALFSGALSSLSSGINAMSANTLQDILVDVLGNSSEVVKTLIAKLVVLLYGVLAVGLAYLARTLSGPVTQIFWTSMGATGGPMVGIMFLGATFPQANWIGALTGGVVGIAFAMWLALCKMMYGNKAPISQKISTSGCVHNVTWDTNNTFPNIAEYNTTMPYSAATDIPFNVTSGPQDDHLAFYDISYLYVGIFGFLVVFIIGIIISLITGMDRGEPTESEYIFPCLRPFWKGGYTAVRVPKTFTVTKSNQAKKMEKFSVPAYIAPIKSLDLSWYNKHSDDEL